MSSASDTPASSRSILPAPTPSTTSESQYNQSPSTHPTHSTRPTQPNRANPHTPQLPSPSSGPLGNISISTLPGPLPLTAAQEAEVKDLYYARVRSACSASIAAFAACATGRTLSVSWACRVERRGMNECMNGKAGREEEDRAREEWFGNLEGRARKKAETEEWREEQRRRKREWWGLDEQGRRVSVDERGVRIDRGGRVEE